MLTISWGNTGGQGRKALSHGDKLLPPTLIVNNVNLPVSSLFDSGEEQNLISSDLVEQLKIHVSPLAHPLTVSALIGHTMTTITHKTANVHFIFSGNHQVEGEFFVFSSLTSHVVLRYP